MGTVLFLSAIFITSSLSTFLYFKNPADSLLPLLLWLGSMLYALCYIGYGTNLSKLIPKKIKLNKFLPQYWLFLLIALLAGIVRFWSLNTIPILTHDEAKDAGLFPQKILSGELGDYFGFFAGINHFFFVLAAVPHLLLADPVVKVRFFSALFGTFSVILIYFLAKKLFDKKTALISMLLLATYHVHIHFSRTEFLNLFDSFYAVIILLVFSVYLAHRSIRSIILLALTLGFGLHFYSGLRALILLTAIIFLVKQKSSVKPLFSILAFFSFFLVAIGPMLVVFLTRPEEAFANGTAKIAESGSRLTDIFTNYTHSLLAYIYEPIKFHYGYGGPFLVLPFSLLFLLGLWIIFKRIKDANFLLIIVALLGIPFFNSALLTDINYTHRLMSLAPIIILVTAAGTTEIANLITKKLSGQVSRIFLITLCAGFSIYNLQLYFVQSVWEKTLYINEFRAWEAQKIINSSNKNQTLTLFLGNTVMQDHLGVHPLPYLTKGHLIISVTTEEQLNTILKNPDYKAYKLIVLPENYANLEPLTIKSRFATDFSIDNRKVFYKNIELFDEVNLTRKY